MAPYALVADDYAEYQTIISLALDFAGYEVEIATNGQEALHRLAQRQYHLMFLDLNMPVMDGITCLRTIRSMRSCDQMHITVVTANSHMSNSIEVETLADYLMLKPLDVAKLAEFAMRLKNVSRMGTTPTSTIPNITPSVTV
jgi:CheY-like chemotaxis protein